MATNLREEFAQDLHKSDSEWKELAEYAQYLVKYNEALTTGEGESSADIREFLAKTATRSSSD